MRVEYSVSSVDDVLDAIRDFMDTISVYVLVEDLTTFTGTSPLINFTNYKYLTYMDGTTSTYFTIYAVNSNIVGMMGHTYYNPEDSVILQQNNMFLGMLNFSTNYSTTSSDRTNRQGTYFSVASLWVGEKGGLLVANFNPENNTVCFSMIVSIAYPYSTDYFTSNLMFGNITKYYEFDGGFFYGSDFCITHEFLKSKSSKTPDYGVDTTNYVLYDSGFTNGLFHVRAYRDPPSTNTHPFVANPYSEQEHLWYSGSKPNTNNIYKPQFFLRIDMDCSPMRTWSPVINTGDDITLQCLWATTINHHLYNPMYVSISNTAVDLPTYRTEVSSSFYDIGYTVNTVNNISLVMPLYFMVRRDPVEKLYRKRYGASYNTFSGVGCNNVINFANMYNMSTNRIIQKSFPDNQAVYNCFNIGRRRAKFGMKGYSGLAFKQEVEEE